MSRKKAPTPPAAQSGSAPATGQPAQSCTTCTITSETFATSPANRARTKIGAGEEVTLSVSPGPATWALSGTSGKLDPASGSASSVVFTANDKAGSVTITATGSGCTCSITLTVVRPADFTMKRAANTNLKHNQNRPDCGWLGTMVIHPNDVNFYNVETRELNSQFVGSGSYAGFNGAWHQPATQKHSAWFSVVGHTDAEGSEVGMNDNIYSGDPGSAATGSAPPFTPGIGHFPITWQWKVVGNSGVHDFPLKRHESEIFANGKCDMRKAGHTETTQHSDPTSTP